MTSNRDGVVTLIVISYNQVRFLPEALASVEAQTYDHANVVLIDDASTDGSSDLLRQWAKAQTRPVELVINPRRRGVTRTVNLGLARARSDYVAFLAADDIWVPDKTAVQVAMFESLPRNVGLIYSDAVMIDEDGTRRGDMFIEGWRQFATPPEGDIFGVLAHGNFIPAPTCMMRCASVARVGAFDEALPYEDWDYWLRLTRHFEVAYCDVPLASYRVVRGSLSRRLTSAEWYVSELTALSKHLDTDEPRRAIVRTALVSRADSLFATGDPRCVGYLRLAWAVDRSPRRFLKWIAARCGFTWKHGQALRGVVRRFGRRRTTSQSTSSMTREGNLQRRPPLS